LAVTFGGKKNSKKEKGMNRKILQFVKVVVLVSLIFPGLAYAQNMEQVVGYETLTVASNAVTVLTAGTYGATATKALVTLEGPANLRYTLDGTAPTTGDAGVGHLWVYNSKAGIVSSVPVLWLGPHELRNFKAIATNPYGDGVLTDDNTAKIKVTYFAKF
jgi:hypothetical protein